MSVISPSQTALDVSALYAEHRLALVRLAILFVDDQGSAEDVVQDVFVALYRRPQAIRDPHAAPSYLRRAVVNGARSVLRRRRTARLHVEESSGTHPPADADLLVAEEHRPVLAAVAQLPPRQREVIVLRYWAGLSEAEIAATLGISPGTVKSNASRGMDKLEEILGGSR